MRDSYAGAPQVPIHVYRLPKLRCVLLSGNPMDLNVKAKKSRMKAPKVSSAASTPLFDAVPRRRTPTRDRVYARRGTRSAAPSATARTRPIRPPLWRGTGAPRYALTPACAQRADGRLVRLVVVALCAAAATAPRRQRIANGRAALCGRRAAAEQRRGQGKAHASTCICESCAERVVVDGRVRQRNAVLASAAHWRFFRLQRFQ